jgi:hypothetical protein
MTVWQHIERTGGLDPIAHRRRGLVQVSLQRPFQVYRPRGCGQGG